MRLEQVGLRVTNLQRSLRFYTKGLGLKVTARGDTRGWGGGLWVQLEDPRSHRNLELNWYPLGSMFGSRYTVGCGVDHIDFTLGVAPVSALETTLLRLLRAGARATPYTPADDRGVDGQRPRPGWNMDHGRSPPHRRRASSGQQILARRGNPRGTVVVSEECARAHLTQ